MGIWLMDSMLRYCKLNIFDIDWNMNIFKEYDQSDKLLKDELRNHWANNGDIISKIYAGTGATTSSVTRRG